MRINVPIRAAARTLDSRAELFGSPWFICSVLMLVANDWLLKPTFHNALTGKLSDFAGLLALALFACAISLRFRWWAAAAVSIAFVFWKSPHSQALIAWLCGVLPFGVGRTPDYGDLVALPVVWVAAFRAPRLSAFPLRLWTRCGFAWLGFCALVATTYIPQYAIREAAEIPVASTGANAIPAELERMIDHVAAKHGLTCTTCDPIADGRVYERAGGALALLARFDQAKREVLYQLRAYTTQAGATSGDVDAIRADLMQALRNAFPAISIALARSPAGDSIFLAVSKQETFSSARDVKNQLDVVTAKRLVHETVTSFGLRKCGPPSWDVHCTGALTGWPPYGRELIVVVSVADSPFISVTVTRKTERFAKEQERIVEELEQRLKAEFGARRAGRCGGFSCLLNY